MAGASLAILTVSIRILEATGVSGSEADQLAQLVAEEVAAVTGAHAEVSRGAPPKAAPRNGEARIELTLDAGLTKIQMVADRSGPGPERRRAEATGPLDVSGWRDRVAGLAGELFPEARAARAKVGAGSVEAPLGPSVPPPAAAPDDATSSILAPILIVASAAAGVAAVGFAISAASSGAELNQGVVFEPELDDLTFRANVHRGAAAGLAAVSVAAIGAVVALLAN